MDEWTRAGGQTAEDETWHAFGSREQYRWAMARRTLERASQDRQHREGQVKSWEASVRRVTDTVPGRGIEWGDAGRRGEYERELAKARDALAAAESIEQAARDALEAAEKATRPKPRPSLSERRIGDAERSVAEAKAKLDALADGDELERASVEAEVREAEAILRMQRVRDGDPDAFLAAMDALDAATAARQAAEQALRAQRDAAGATETGATA